MSTTSSDPIADMLSRVRNAIAVQRGEISLPYSKAKEAVARLLMANEYILDVRVSEPGVGKSLTIVLQNNNENARITEINRLSKPGRRLYSSADKIPIVKRGRGVVIVSTSQGLMTGRQAKKQHLGGELICEVY